MKAIKLKKKYGTLTVDLTFTSNGRRRASCTCKCGRNRTVLVYHLTSGHTKTCGAASCRPPRRSTVRLDPSYHPVGNGMTAAQLHKIWTDLNDRTQTRAGVARDYNYNYNTMATLERSIRRAGGIERYIRLVDAP